MSSFPLCLLFPPNTRSTWCLLRVGGGGWVAGNEDESLHHLINTTEQDRDFTFGKHFPPLNKYIVQSVVYCKFLEMAQEQITIKLSPIISFLCLFSLNSWRILHCFFRLLDGTLTMPCEGVIEWSVLVRKSFGVELPTRKPWTDSLPAECRIHGPTVATHIRL